MTWSPLSLGRWFGTTVRVHILLIFFVASRLLWSSVNLAAVGKLPELGETACWMGLLLLALAVHELAHALTAYWLDCDQEDVHLWPLGNLVGPSYVPRSGEHFLVAMAGPFISGALFLGIAVGLNLLAGAQVVWNPFGNTIAHASASGGTIGAPWVHQGAELVTARPLSRVWILGWFGYLNWVLMLANLIPALPFDGGRMLRAVVGSTSVISSRDNPYAFYAARAFALILGFAGLMRLLVSWRLGDGLTLILLALIIEYLVRVEARLLEEGGYFDDGMFGYDFSEGYTSLESGSAKVRPHRESALKRWRRRRSELRRERRMAREIAEERRMDEILEKIHREGRGALSDEENRFLVRVSARYRNRTKNT
ncbi:MAG: metalloprotease [Isosphaeraceae bacterium]